MPWRITWIYKKYRTIVASLDIVYSKGNRILCSRIPNASDIALQAELGHIKKYGSPIVILIIKHNVLGFRKKAIVKKHYALESLHLKYRLFKFIRNEYANGDVLVTKLNKVFKERNKEERIRKYEVPLKVETMPEVFSEIKNNVLHKPVLILFNSNESLIWKEQRSLYGRALVENEESVSVVEVRFNKQSPQAAEAKKVFFKFNIGRVPSWIMVTPVRKAGVLKPHFSRFDAYCDKYFLGMVSEGRKKSKETKADELEEAFGAFVSWGMTHYDKL